MYRNRATPKQTPLKARACTRDTFCMPFGLYENTTMVDLVNLRKVKHNKVTEEEYTEYTGKEDLQFPSDQPWLNGPVKKLISEALCRI